MKSVVTQPQPSKEYKEFDVEAIRERARQNIEDGAVTPAYQADREHIIELLNVSLATELICVLRYKRHAEMAKGIHAEAAVQEFLEHMKVEQEHADELAGRITQLNGEPDYNPDHFSAKSHTQYVECNSLKDMIKENLIAERIVIDSYTQMIREIGDSDPTTRRLLEHILEEEEEHAEELANMLGTYPKEEGQAWSEASRH